MKKIAFIFVSLLSTVLVSAYFIPNPLAQATAQQKKSTCGYVIIEYGKGIDCNGDTIRLVKKNGIQVRANAK